MLMAGLALAALGAALALLSPPVVPSRGGAGGSAAAAPPWLREASRGASPRLRVNSKGQCPITPVPAAAGQDRPTVGLCGAVRRVEGAVRRVEGAVRREGGQPFEEPAGG